jgi:hypothetical protein
MPALHKAKPFVSITKGFLFLCLGRGGIMEFRCVRPHPVGKQGLSVIIEVMPVGCRDIGLTQGAANACDAIRFIQSYQVLFTCPVRPILISCQRSLSFGVMLHAWLIVRNQGLFCCACNWRTATLIASISAFSPAFSSRSVFTSASFCAFKVFTASTRTGMRLAYATDL